MFIQFVDELFLGDFFHFVNIETFKGDHSVNSFLLHNELFILSYTILPKHYLRHHFKQNLNFHHFEIIVTRFDLFNHKDQYQRLFFRSQISKLHSSYCKVQFFHQERKLDRFIFLKILLLQL